MGDLDRSFAKDPRIVSRQIDTETILVPIRNDVGDLESIYTLNEVGARIWDLLDGTRTLGDIVDLITAEFEVNRQEATVDLIEFVEKLKKINGVVEVATQKVEI